MNPRFVDLYPDGIDMMPVAWHQVRIPGPPQSLALTAEERYHPDPLVRFRRRIIQHLRTDGVGGDHLALVDKAIPHALYDLMLTDLARPSKATAEAVLPATGRALWGTGRRFIQFVSDPDIRREFNLGQGQAVLAMNCDPVCRWGGTRRYKPILYMDPHHISGLDYQYHSVGHPSNPAGHTHTPFHRNGNL